jgi:hypothetical protein
MLGIRFGHMVEESPSDVELTGLIFTCAQLHQKRESRRGRNSAMTREALALANRSLRGVVNAHVENRPCRYCHWKDLYGGHRSIWQFD